LFLGERISAARAHEIGMVNRVVPRAQLQSETRAIAEKAINQAEDRMGLRDVMDSTFALHHLAHAHNSLTSEDHLAGLDTKSMAKSLK
jgi:enoyl-CoA hydratase